MTDERRNTDTKHQRQENGDEEMKRVNEGIGVMDDAMEMKKRHDVKKEDRR